MDRFMPDENFLARWMSGELSDAELAVWKASPDYVEYMRILDTSAALEVPASRSEADVWNELSAKLTEAPVVQLTPEPKRVRWPQWTLVAAAAIALLFALFLFLPNTSTHQTLAAQTEKVTLPDGSVVHLHADSRVSYPTSWDGERSIKLEGEAFFEVRKGSKFTVSTPKGVVEVLGTSFNVKARKQNFETVCYTGKVRVATFGKENELILTPGLGASLTQKGELQQTDLSLNEPTPDWMKGIYKFDNASPQEIVEEFERIFDVKIQLEIENTSTYDHAILSNNPLKTELEKLTLNFGAQYKYDADQQIRILPMP